MLFADDDPEEKAQGENAVKSAKLKAKKKAPIRHNKEGKKVIGCARLMSQLERLCRLVVLPKIGTDTGQKGTIDISPAQRRAFKLL